MTTDSAWPSSRSSRLDSLFRISCNAGAAGAGATGATGATGVDKVALASSVAILAISAVRSSCDCDCGCGRCSKISIRARSCSAPVSATHPARVLARVLNLVARVVLGMRIPQSPLSSASQVFLLAGLTPATGPGGPSRPVVLFGLHGPGTPRTLLSGRSFRPLWP